MSFRIRSNSAALNAQNSLVRASRGQSNTMARVSSGMRITKAADDAAGLAVSENLESRIRSMSAARRNINDGLSAASTAEGANHEVSQILKRMRELAVQSSSETLASSERTYVQDEVDQLASEMRRIFETTEFNGVALFDFGGAGSTLDVQVGINDTAFDTIGIRVAAVTGISALSLSTATSAQAALVALDTGLDTLNSQRSDLGASFNRLSAALRNVEVASENTQGSKSEIKDADFAQETSQLVRFEILQNASVAMLAQANQLQQSALRLIG